MPSDDGADGDEKRQDPGEDEEDLDQIEEVPGNDSEEEEEDYDNLDDDNLGKDVDDDGNDSDRQAMDALDDALNELDQALNEDPAFAPDPNDHTFSPARDQRELQRQQQQWKQQQDSDSDSQDKDTAPSPRRLSAEGAPERLVAEAMREIRGAKTQQERQQAMTEMQEALDAKGRQTARAKQRQQAKSSHPGKPGSGPGEDEEDDPFDCCTGRCMSFCVAILALILGLLMYSASDPDPLDTRVTVFKGDGVLRTVVWPGQAGGAQPGVRGPNGRDTDWAVFFYKPYCGACQRVWPAFRALGATTNSSGRLRFGEVDCVADRGVCSMMKAEKHPVVRIYRATSSWQSKSGTTLFKREQVAEWSGLLIAYEVVDWFKSLQQGEDALLDGNVTWAPDAELASAMRRFKSRGRTQHESSLTHRPSDPAGYLTDAEASFAFGLTDHVFPHASAPLEGDRLESLLNWLDLHSRTFPKKRVRDQIRSLRTRLGARTKWERGAYETAVRTNGFSTDPPAESSWRWCTRERMAGRGGYSCALWVLLHTTLANSPRTQAKYALQVMALWVNDFFGCEECATHFVRYYEEHGGADVSDGQIGAVLWLWRAHNAVTQRLKAAEEADSAFGEEMSSRRSEFPARTDCKACYNATKGAFFVEEHSVFEYLQEVYCYESDTFVCAGFDDPSKAKDGRAKKQD